MLYRLQPEVLNAISIVKPDTVVRWHGQGFRAHWRRKSRPGPGRPPIPKEVRSLIREIRLANPLWGAPRIYGERLTLGIDVGQPTIAKCMVKGAKPPSQSWRTFLPNQSPGIASRDLFVAPTAAFSLLFGFFILRHDRRRWLHVAVTAHPYGAMDRPADS